jgi:hypothetical protein
LEVRRDSLAGPPNADVLNRHTNVGVAGDN